MNKRTEVFLGQLTMLIDAAVLVATFLATFGLRHASHFFYRLDLIPGREVLPRIASLDAYLWLLLIILPVWIGLLYWFGSYRQLRISNFPQTLFVVVKANLVGMLCFGFVVFLLKLSLVSRTFMALFFVLSVATLVVERGVLMACFRLMTRRGFWQRQLLVVGSGPRAIQFAQRIQSHSEWGLRIIGFVDDDLSRAATVAAHVPGAPLLGRMAELSTMLRERVVDEVVFVLPRTWMNKIENAIADCEVAGVRATVAMDLFNMRFAKAQPTDLDGMPLLSFETTSIDDWALATKRLVDIVASGIGLLLLAPVFPIVALLITRTSPGPVLFRQIRYGLNGRPFTLYKFRTMVADAEARLKQLEDKNELKGSPAFKVTKDPRLTMVGIWLRKTSIDELPQLLNVFKGEMSLVGPRPLPSQVSQYTPKQRRRLSMRPGLTGYWQVNGRSRITDFDRWTQLDLEYIDRWSLALDMKILFKTVPTVLLGLGAK